MSKAADFSLLYAELGLEPGTGLDQLKHAYRRRVGMLHPDTNGDRGDTERLQSLNQLYNAALDFHRVHGRLPGAAPRAGPSSSSEKRTQQTSPPVARSDEEPRAAHSGRFAVALTLATLIASALWLQRPGQADNEASHKRSRAPGAAAPAPEGHASPPVGVGLGTSRDQVAALHGQPHVVDGSRWVYGPSWVEFRCGAVVDWYSSALHPLQVPVSRPSVDTDWLAPKPAGACIED